MHARYREEPVEEIRMSLGRFRCPDYIHGEPIPDLLPGIGDRLGAREYSRVCANTHEGQQTRPRKAYLDRAIQLLVKPFAAGLVLR